MGLIATCKNSKTVTLPPCLAEWIDRNMPELGGVSSVEIVCCDPLVVGFAFIKGKQGGFTPSKKKIYVTECSEPIDPCDFRRFGFVYFVLHELIHVLQRRRHPKSFSLRYLLRLIKAKFNAKEGGGHKDEEHAYKRAKELLEKYKRDNPCNCSPPHAVGSELG